MGSHNNKSGGSNKFRPEEDKEFANFIHSIGHVHQVQHILHEKGRQITAMVSAGHVYSEYAINFLQDANSKSNTHHVVEFDRNTTRFRVEEMVNPKKYVL